MAIDQVPDQQSDPRTAPTAPVTSHAVQFAVVFAILIALVLGQLYAFHRINTVRDSLQTQQAKMQNAYATQLSERLNTLEQSNAQRLGAIKQELDADAKRMGTTGRALGRARSLVAQLQKEQTQQSEMLKQEISKKADQQQLLALTQDVSSAKTDLDSTKKNVNALTQDLGMARSELGTLIARNHDEIEQLRKLGDRDYFEFKLAKDQIQHVAGVGLTLKKTNMKRHRFNMVLAADDLEVEKKDRTVNEPIFFYTSGSKKAYELVVNKVQSRQVVGYLSIPKGAAVQVAARSEGTR